MLPLRKLTGRLYIADDQHWIRLADRYYRYCYLSKLPTDEYVSEDEVEFPSLPTSKATTKKISSKVEEHLSEDQIGKPVAIIDDNTLVANALEGGS